MSTVDPQNINGLLSSGGSYTFEPNEGVDVTGRNFGDILNVEVIEDDIIVTTNLGTLTINDVPELTTPRANTEGISYLNTALADEDFLVDFSDIIKLFFEQNQEQRNTNREVRNVERDLMVSTGQEAADKMREAALLTLIGGVVQSATTISSGAMGVKGGIKGLRIGGNEGQIVSNMYSSKGTIREGYGGIASAAATYSASLTQAEQKELEIESGLHSSKAQDASDEFKNDYDMIQQAVQMLQQMYQSQHSINSEIIQSV